MTAQKRMYRPKEICHMLEISARQLGYWRLIGVVKPRKKVRGSKVFHYYSEKDLNILKEVRGLTARGYFVSKAAQRVRTGLRRSEPGKLIGLQEERRAVHFDARFKEEWSRSQRFRYPLSCIVMKLVSFQDMRITQQQRVLRQLKEIILKTKRAYDLIARTNDDEFIWLLPQSGKHGAVTVKSRLRSALQAARRKVSEEKPLTRLVHLGTASALPSNHKVEDLAGRAREGAQAG
jgi:diguanylate cyclase (GGDEF)-like protein